MPRRHFVCQNTLVDHRAFESELGPMSDSKEFVLDRVARAETDGSPPQKLPSTAIYCHLGIAKPLSPL